MVEVTTLFDSDEAENEYMNEQEAKRRKAEKEYIEVKEVLKTLNCLVNDCPDKEEFYNRVFEEIDAMPAADVVPRTEFEALKDEADRYKRYYFRHDYDEMIAEAKTKAVEEIFNEIAKMFSEKQRSYEYSRQTGKARQMMVARFEVHKLHKKYKEAHNG